MSSACRCWASCFNEAAANSPRKEKDLGLDDATWSGFNEAAANSPRKAGPERQMLLRELGLQ